MIHALLVSALWAAPQQVPPPGQAPPPAPVGEGSVGAPPSAGQAAEGETPAQAPQPAASPSGGRPDAILVDSVQLIVNDKCITISDLRRMAAQQGKQASSLEEFYKLLEQSAHELTRWALMEQAGRDLGYDEALVRSMVTDRMERQKESIGSAAALARELDRFSLDSSQLKEDIEGRTYRDLWQGAVTGRYQGPGGRLYVDRYVRPGQILLEFERRGASLDLPTKIQLEQMIIAPALGDTADSARQKAELVRRRLLNGESFQALNTQFGVPDLPTELEPIEEGKLALHPEVKAFVDGASPGDISEVLPVVSSAKVAGYQILRFVARQQGRAASFVDRQFQSLLADEVQERRDKASQDRALRRLQDAAYVWPPELVEARQPQQAAPPPQATPQPQAGTQIP